MTKFRLELSRIKTNDKLVLGAAHIAAMTGNTFYPAATRVPTDAQVQTAQDDLATAQAEVDAAEIAWKQKIQARDQKEVSLCRKGGHENQPELGTVSHEPNDRTHREPSASRAL